VALAMGVSCILAAVEIGEGVLDKACELPPLNPPPLVLDLLVCGPARKCGFLVLAGCNFFAIMLASFILLLILSPLLKRGHR
jgi:hypothetical protein